MFRWFALVWIVLGLSVTGTQPVFAETTDARCDIYPRGAKQLIGQYLCVLSEYHGYVSIRRGDGVQYDFHPSRNQPGKYRDGQNRPVSLRGDLGKKGVIFELTHESIYVYWDTSVLAEPAL